MVVILEVIYIHRFNYRNINLPSCFVKCMERTSKIKCNLRKREREKKRRKEKNFNTKIGLITITRLITHNTNLKVS